MRVSGERIAPQMPTHLMEEIARSESKDPELGWGRRKICKQRSGRYQVSLMENNGIWIGQAKKDDVMVPYQNCTILCDLYLSEEFRSLQVH